MYICYILLLVVVAVVVVVVVVVVDKVLRDIFLNCFRSKIENYVVYLRGSKQQIYSTNKCLALCPYGESRTNDSSISTLTLNH